MASKFGAWRQKIKQHWVAIVVVAIVLVVVIVLIVGGYRFDWAGFNGYNKVSIATETTSSPPKITRTEEYQPGKTLWDWLQLLVIPLVLAAAAFLFNFANSRTERQIAKQRYEQDQQIALDKQHEDLLQAYLDRIAELLLERQLGTSPSEEVKNVARVRTITVLTQLNARRIGYVFTFLRESELMSTASDNSVVSLKGADLRAVKWEQANLSDANLSGANLKGADLSSANLIGAYLCNAYLNLADLSKATLWGADLSEAILVRTTLSEADLNSANLSKANLADAHLNGAHLISANLIGAYLSGAHLTEAHLRDADLNSANLTLADLSFANLSNANLSNANLWGVTLWGANLSNANLSNANLSDAFGITIEELEKQTKLLQGATMPDGSIYP